MFVNARKLVLLAINEIKTNVGIKVEDSEKIMPATRDLKLTIADVLTKVENYVDVMIIFHLKQAT